MFETIQGTKTVTARKPHRCDWCGLPINKGEKYHYAVYKYDGSVYSWKNHISCGVLVSDLDMVDDCDEGVTEDDFREFVWTYFRDFHPNGNDLYDEIEWEEALLWAKENLGAEANQ